MKKLICVCVILTFISTLFTQNILLARVQKSNRYSLAVLNLTIKSGEISRNEARLFTGRLTDELSRGGLFYTMAQPDMERGLMVKNFDPSGCETVDCAVQLGGALGVQLAVIGTINQNGQIYSLKLQMVHVASREIVKSHQDVYDGSFPELIEKVPLITSQFVGQPVATSPVKPSTSNRLPIESSYNNGGGFKWYYWGLGLVIAGGAGAGIFLATKNSNDNKPPLPIPGSNLPGPPSFP